jgi:vacuolar-type H+-ATPase subunit F/Vma7
MVNFIIANFFLQFDAVIGINIITVRRGLQKYIKDKLIMCVKVKCQRMIVLMPSRCKEKTLTKNYGKAIITFVALG